MKAPRRGCGSCRFADWARLGGLRKKGPGDCRFEPATTALPDSVTKAHGYRADPSRQSIWKDWGEECPVWVAAEAPSEQ